MIVLVLGFPLFFRMFAFNTWLSVFARAKYATQIVIGASRRNPLLAVLTGPGTGPEMTEHLGYDKHDPAGRE